VSELSIERHWPWRIELFFNVPKNGCKVEALHESCERVAEQAATLPDTCLVHVADREGDIAALMALADTLGHPADWLIRARHNRNLAEEGKLWDQVKASEVLGDIAFILPGRAGQKAREVRQALRASRIELPGKRQFSVTCVVAREIDAPAGVTPVVWRLITNRLAPHRDAVIELIDWYRARSEIEIFFDVLKNCCKVEALQLSSIEQMACPDPHAPGPDLPENELRSDVQA
jgi:hypothetical protein